MRWPPAYNIFLTFLPDLDTALGLAAFGHQLKREHLLNGAVRPFLRFHASIHAPGHPSEFSEEMLEAVREACAAVSAWVSSFDVRFDHFMTFPNKTGIHPLVLVGSRDCHAAVMEFHRKLLSELEKRCCAGKNKKCTPHVTILYDERILPAVTFTPVGWTVNEFALVGGAPGAPKYDVLGSWALRP